MPKIAYRGETYPVIDPLEWLLAEASLVKRQTGQTVGEIMGNAMRSDAEAVAALIYVAKKRAGEKVRWEDLNDFTLGECEFITDDDEARGEYSPADKVDATGEGGADPTSPTGTTQDRGGSTTSRRSRSTSGSTRAKSTS